jgi:pyridoxine/pyridoxamine 5'-phosphate oxidase
VAELNTTSEHRDAQRTRPGFAPGYGVEANPEGMLRWAWVDERMGVARNYWVATTAADGRAQVAPVWGVWFDDTFFFGTGVTSRKGRNLARDPRLAVHLESGDEVVILEGVAEPLTDPVLFARYVDAYDAKYAIRPDSADGGTFFVRPRRVFAWLEHDFLHTPTRWTFEDARFLK